MKRTQSKTWGLSHYVVEIDVGKAASKPRVASELSDAELKAIGLIAAQWSRVEDELFRLSNAFAQHLKIALPRDGTSSSFTRRLNAFRELCQSLEATEKQKWLDVSDRIANLEGQRHKVVHGLWAWNTAREDVLTSVHGTRPPHQYTQPMTISTLHSLGRKVSELLFELAHPSGLPDVYQRVLPIRQRKIPGLDVTSVPMTIPP